MTSSAMAKNALRQNYAPVPLAQLFRDLMKWADRGSAADQGVRPTNGWEDRVSDWRRNGP